MHPDNLQRAITGLLINHPFFAAILLRQEVTADTNCATAYVDGKRLGYNPEFIAKLSHDELMGLLAHEVMHLTLAHHARMKGRNSEQWNQACDYAINPLLKAEGFALPQGALLDPAYNGKSAEEIYRLLPTPPPQPQGGKGEGKGQQWGEVRQCEGEPSNAEETATVQRKQAEGQAKRAGKLPVFIERAIQAMPPRADWREILARFVCEQAPKDLHWHKPNRRMLAQGMILPGITGQTYGKLVFAADTSGSISPDDVSKVASELLAALQTMQDDNASAELLAIYCDSAIQGVETLDGTRKPSPKGGGGTDFRPPFDYVAREGIEPRALVYFTDGYCYSFPKPPPYPVLWLLIGNYSEFRPPFGEVCKACME